MPVRLLHIAGSSPNPLDLNELAIVGGVVVLRAEHWWREPLEWARERPDVVVIELSSLEESSSVEVATLVRLLDAPVVVVGPDHAQTHARMLAAGADCYLARSSAGQLLGPQVESMLRKRLSIQKSPRLLIGDLLLDQDAMTAYVGPAQISLSSLEFALVSALAERNGRVCRRVDLSRVGYGARDLSDRSLENHICRLRRKLRLAGSVCQIVTDVGVGYRLAVGDSLDLTGT